MIKKEFEQWVLQNLAPKDSQENPAFPNYTDLDIWLEGFKAGFEYKSYKHFYELFKQLNEFDLKLDKLREQEILDFAKFIGFTSGIYEDDEGKQYHYENVKELYEIYKKYYLKQWKND